MKKQITQTRKPSIIFVWIVYKQNIYLCVTISDKCKNQKDLKNTKILFM